MTLTVGIQPLVVLSFDDGPSTDNTWALPLLASKGVPGVFCIISSHVNAALPTFPFTYPSLIAAQALGHEIVSHSRTHVDLRTPPADAALLDSEITGSFADFTSHGVTPAGFCWPGNGNDATCRAVAQASFRYALGNLVEGNNVPGFNQFSLQRQAILNGRTLASYTAKVDSAIANNELCIFLTHSFTTDATQQANLAALIDYTLAAGVPIVTASTALTIYRDRHLIYPDTVIYPWTMIYPWGIDTSALWREVAFTLALDDDIVPVAPLPRTDAAPVDPGLHGDIPVRVTAPVIAARVTSDSIAARVTSGSIPSRTTAVN